MFDHNLSLRSMKAAHASPAGGDSSVRCSAVMDSGGSLRDIRLNMEEIETFLAPARFAAVTSLRNDGGPLTIPLGYLYEDGNIYLAVRNGRGLPKRVAKNPRVCVCIFNMEFPSMAVIFEGDARQIADPGNERAIKIVRRYITHVDDGGASSVAVDIDEFQRNWLTGGRSVFEIVPEKIISWDRHKQDSYEEEAGITVSEVMRAKW